ncbi:3-oxoacyl-ACP reductase [Bacillus cereus]|uniref:SDR family NAD(P)-dependent oxidoreductase n=1 Tax=Bacillus sp. AFS023182 TaxID=2033492 RepID=UPI000BF3F981|nr:glucose 1-dehydrogenase [Bacillus sp. AFS023182]PFE01011.1 3-oxoacyl-ACP reductase [Bacillus sp. AFS023182]PGX91130.1 3-oxoacyl-ACP reductase [Bacillus cereus]
MQLDSKVAIVTGGTRGIGKAIAKTFLEAGAIVICAARKENEFKELHSQFPLRAIFSEVDVRDAESVKQMVQSAISNYGQVDIMVANAGVLRDSLLINMTCEDWNESINTNLNGVFNCTHAVIEHMVERKSGHIINVSSAAATRVNIGQANYCASKAGVEMFTKVAAMELGPHGVRVNCLSPGIIEEGMGAELVKKEKIWERYQRRMALRRAGTSDEISKAALFLVTDSSSYVNGHVLEVNGGLLWG